MWFHPDGIANILSLSRVKTKYHITFDSDTTNEFIVHKPDGFTRNFKESSRGLYYHDTSTDVAGVAETGTALVTTVADNASNYTHADYSRTLLAHKTQQIIGDRIPSTNPGAEPPRDARDSGSARSHSTHLETSSSDRL